MQFIAPTTHDEVLEMWRRALRAGAYRMLEIVIEAGDVGISREELAEVSGFTASGGTFSTYLSDLRRNGLIAIHGTTVVATDVLQPA